MLIVVVSSIIIINNGNPLGQVLQRLSLRSPTVVGCFLGVFYHIRVKSESLLFSSQIWFQCKGRTFFGVHETLELQVQSTEWLSVGAGLSVQSPAPGSVPSALVDDLPEQRVAPL